MTTPAENNDPSVLLSVDRVSKVFHTDEVVVPAIENVSFTVRAGEFVTILGPSGSGKSTLLNLLAGLLRPDSGSIAVQSASGEPHGVAYMPQRDLLLPWRRIIDNATLPLLASGMARKQAREAVEPLLPVFGLDGFAELYPAELSGGMRQRAALLRTVSGGGDILLLDEPFGALDAITRRQMQDWLLSVFTIMHKTVLFITHDVDEAVYLADRVIVFSPRPGRVIREVTVPVPRPRDQSMTGLPEFGTTVAALLDDLGLTRHVQ